MVKQKCVGWNIDVVTSFNSLKKALNDIQWYTICFDRPKLWRRSPSVTGGLALPLPSSEVSSFPLLRLPSLQNWGEHCKEQSWKVEAHSKTVALSPTQEREGNREALALSSDLTVGELGACYTPPSSHHGQGGTVEPRRRQWRLSHQQRGNCFISLNMREINPIPENDCCS